MKYAYLFLLNIFIIHNLSFANDDIDNLCKEFLDSSKNTAINLMYSEDILFKTGVLWKITSTKKLTNYMYGTIHSQDYSVSKFPYEVELTLIKSNKLILEIIPDSKANKIYKENIYFNNGIKLDNLLGEYFFKND